MAETIRVVICSGTHCYVMGASDILLLEEHLPADVRARVSIEGATCLGLCKDPKNGRAPYVTVDGELIAHATLPAVLCKIQERVYAEHK